MKTLSTALLLLSLSLTALWAGDKNHIHIDLPSQTPPPRVVPQPTPNAPVAVPLPSVAPVPNVTPANPAASGIAPIPPSVTSPPALAPIPPTQPR